MTNFAKFIFNYFFTGSSRPLNWELMVCNQFIQAADRNSSRDALIVAYIFKKYKRTFKMDYEFLNPKIIENEVDKGNLCVKRGEDASDSYYYLNPKLYKKYKDYDLQFSLEDKFLKKVYEEPLRKFGLKTNWKKIRNDEFWDDCFEDYDLRNTEPVRINLAYVYKNMIQLEGQLDAYYN